MSRVQRMLSASGRFRFVNIFPVLSSLASVINIVLEKQARRARAQGTRAKGKRGGNVTSDISVQTAIFPFDQRTSGRNL